MPRQLATIRAIAKLTPIKGADRIELASIDGWQCVVKKGEFNVGDYCAFFEIDSSLPEHSAFGFLKAGQRRRLKTVKLRGQLSQGLALPWKNFPELCSNGRGNELLLDYELGADITEVLGVTKWEPTLSASLGGIVRSTFPSGIVPKTDEERVQNCASEIKALQGKPYDITIKLDGTSFTFIHEFDGNKHVCSRNQDLSYSDNAYWKAAKNCESIEPGYAIQGELCGPGIQKNRLDLDKLGLFVFNVWSLDAEGPPIKLSYADALQFCVERGLKMVPLLESGEDFQYTREQLLEMAEGKYDGTNNEREGIVIRLQGATVPEDALSFKAISNRFLLGCGH